MTIQDTPEFLSDKNQWVEIFDALEIPKSMNYNHNSEGAEKWLVVCRGGNTRSTAIALLLKYKYGKDALAASIEKNTRQTLYMLTSWADKILVTEPDHYEFIRQFTPRVRLLSLDRVERLRAHPYEIEFLKQIDAKLKYFLEEKSVRSQTAST